MSENDTNKTEAHSGSGCGGLLYGEHLKNEGWVRGSDSFSNCDSVFYKRYKDAKPCKCNSDKQGIQCVIRVWAGFPEPNSLSFETSVTGQTVSGQWVKLAAYGIDTVEKAVEKAVQMVDVWNRTQSI